MKNKQKHYRIIILTEDFGNNKKGTVMRCEAILALRLINRKVAKIYDGALPVGSIAEILDSEEKGIKNENKKTKKK